MYNLPGLETRYLGRDFIHLDQVDSTNNYLKERALGLSHGTAVLADFQTGGKGRLGRSWSNPKGHSLSFSFLLSHNLSMEDMALLPLIVGLGVCEGLSALCGRDFAIKWSNDVLAENKKVCGILCESRVSQTGSNPFAVVGIGVNLLQTREDFTRLDLLYANSLFLVTGKLYEPPPVAAAILNHLEPLLDLFRAEGFEALRPRYKNHCVTLDRTVRIHSGDQPQEVFAQDIGPDGSLICRMPDGSTQSLLAGETSVRGLYGYV